MGKIVVAALIAVSTSYAAGFMKALGQAGFALLFTLIASGGLGAIILFARELRIELSIKEAVRRAETASNPK